MSRTLLVMENDEQSQNQQHDEDDDGKPAARPQHEEVQQQSMEQEEEDTANSSATATTASTRRRTRSNPMNSTTSLQFLSAEPPPLKRIKLEGSLSHASLGVPSLSYSNFATSSNNSSKADLHHKSKDSGEPKVPEHNRAITPPKQQQVDHADSKEKGLVSPETAYTSEQAGTSSTSLHSQGATSTLSKAQQQEAPDSPPPPFKATTMSHLKKKYMTELEYMLREFQKLERQLLGAKSSTAESAASRERREKLHSFILHLQETIQQVHLGCQLEAEGKSTVVGAGHTDDKKEFAESAALTNLTREKEEEENVQKLEEHILANLLPVKVRLKKQLAAQQGAKHNPAGMPASRQGYPSASSVGKGTFAAAAEQRRKQQEALASLDDKPPAELVAPDQTQFGKPLTGGGGSSLTKKLHGPTLGSASRVHGHGVGSEKTTATAEPEKPKILFAGMAIGSDHMQSSLSAASTAHNLVIKDPALLELSKQQKRAVAAEAAMQPNAAHQNRVADKRPEIVLSKAAAEVPILSEEERRRVRRKRQKRKKMREQAAAAAAAAQIEQQQRQATKTSRKKPSLKKRGPRTVEYTCALCNETYNSSNDYNPWWALAKHECPKCRKMQIPRVDIGAPANSIQYHPALLAHADEQGGGGGGGGNAAGDGMQMPPAQLKAPEAPATSVKMYGSDSDSFGSDLSDEDLDGLLSDDDDVDTDESDLDALDSMSPAEEAEKERFGFEYSGPKLEDEHAARLLILMEHASTCPCRHKSKKHREVCRSTKWMMLHVRDCPGTTATFDVCPFPWCRKVKHLLYHLVSCTEPESCKVCSPESISGSLSKLKGLNGHRLRKYRERMIARAKAAAAARAKALAPSTKQAPAKSTVPPQAAQRKLIQGKPLQQQRPTALHVTTTAVRPSGTAQPLATAIASTASKPVHSDSQNRPASNATETNAVSGGSHNANANGCNTSEKSQASTKQMEPNVDAARASQISTGAAAGETAQTTEDKTDVKMSAEKQVKIEESSAEPSHAESVVVDKTATSVQETVKVETTSREAAAEVPCIKEEDSKTEAASASPVIKEEDGANDPTSGQTGLVPQVKQEEPKTEIVSKGSSNSPVSDKATAEPLQVQ